MILKYSLLILVMFAAQTVFAADSSKDKQGVSGSFELGAQTTTGDSNVTSLNGAIHVNQNLEHWRNLYAFESIYSDSEHITTSEINRASMQSNYKYNDHEFWFIKESAEKDIFSGYKYKTSISSGYGNRVWENEEGSFLVASAGLGYKRNELEAGTAGDDFDQGAIASFSVHYSDKISPTSTFRETLNTQLDLEHLETVTDSTASIQASIYDNLALKLSYRIEYSSKPPIGNAKTDTESSVTLLYSF